MLRGLFGILSQICSCALVSAYTNEHYVPLVSERWILYKYIDHINMLIK